MSPNQKRGWFLKKQAENVVEPSYAVPVPIRRLRLPAGPAGSMFAWMQDRLDKQRCRVDESRRRLADRRKRKAETMRRYRAKLRAARPDLKAIWQARHKKGPGV